ncbi:MAG: hypothetical protein WBD22_04615 [Pyrinomonadaceae bacterium]
MTNKLIDLLFGSLFIVVLLNGCSTTLSDRKENLAFSTEPYDANWQDDYILRTKSPFSISLSLVDSVIVVNQPVLVRLTFENHSNEAIRVDLGEDFKQGLSFTVTSPGQKRTKLPSLTREGISREGVFWLKSQQTYSQNIVLNEWTEFPKIGNYKVEMQMTNPIRTAGGETHPFTERATVALDVKPEDSQYLRSIAVNLEERLQQSKTYAEAAEIALALSYVQNPVAVPSLQQALLSDKMVESVIINSLRQQSGNESIDVLTGVIEKAPNSEAAIQARSALEWMERQISDSQLKERIRSFRNGKN